MKKSIIYLGIALVTFTNVALALDFQQSSNDENFNAAQTVLSIGNLESGANPYSTAKENDMGDRNLADATPEAIDVPTYQKTIEEIIAENNQIIESTISPAQFTEEGIAEENLIETALQVSPANNEEAMVQRITQDSQIIESLVLNATKKEQK